MKLKKTETGLRVMKDRSVPLSPRQRAAFILFDGRNTVDQVLAATGAAGVTREDVDHLVSVGLLERVEPSAAPPAATAPFIAPAPATAVPAPMAPAEQALHDDAPPSAEADMVGGRSDQQRYQDAYPVATRLTASLGLRGFRLNLAVEAALNLEQLRELGPRIRDAVGDKAYRDLERALNG